MMFFRAYESPKFGIFSITTDKYGSDGWICKHEKYKIIGEYNETYVTRLVKSVQGEWIDDKVVKRTYILPIGIHKSRLIKWTSGQLSIF